MTKNKLKNIYIITTMILCCIISFNTELKKGDEMAKGYPDWSVDNQNDISVSSYDVTNPNLYDYVDFSGGAGKPVISADGQYINDNFVILFGGTNGSSTTSREYYYYNPVSLKIVGGQTDPYQFFIKANFPLLNLDTFGLNIIMTRIELNTLIRVGVSVYYPTHSVHFLMRHEPLLNSIGVVDKDDIYIPLLDNVNTIIEDKPLWNYYKLVGSLVNNKYSHIIFNGRLATASSVEKDFDLLSTGDYYIKISLSVFNSGVTTDFNLINAIIFTVNEPLLL